MKTKRLDLLYVEDDATDVELARNAIELSFDANKVNMEVVDDGEKALKFLSRTAPFSHAIIPDIILLDLNLPKIHGHDVLKTIKQDKELKKIPVVIFTTSGQQEDVDESYELGAAGFLTKPNQFKEYQEIFKALSDFWFKNARLPTKLPRSR